MRAPLFTLLCLSLAAGQVRLAAPISRVRLYPDQAWVIREARFPFASAGSQRLRLESLPADLNLENLRVQANGLPGLRLGNVAVIQEEGRFEPDAETRGWMAERNLLLPRIQDLHLRQAALEAALKALESLKPQPNENDRAKAAVDPLAAAEFSRASQTHQQLLFQKGMALDAEVKPLQARYDALGQGIAHRELSARRRTSTVLVELEAPQSGEAHLVLETQTSDARWKPLYEARLLEDDRHLELLCYAAVSQASGEDWKGVGLEISNAQPGRNLSLPVSPEGLQVLYEAPGMVSPGNLQGRVIDRHGQPAAGIRLTAANGQLKVTRTVISDANGVFRFPFLPAGDYVLRGVQAGHPEIVASTRIEAGKTQSLGLTLGEISGASAVVEVVGTMASADANSTSSSMSYTDQTLSSLPGSRFDRDTTATLAPGVARPPLVAALETATPLFEDAGELGRAWFLEGRNSLPSDAQPRRMLLAKATLDATLGLRAVPRLSTEVFSMAMVTPTAGFPWFPGTPVSVFRAGERLGLLPLPALLAGEPVAFSFGPRVGLSVQRKRLEARMVGTKAQKGRQWSLKERVTLVNDLNQEVEVEVMEPALRSASDKVRIEALASDLAPTRTTDRGFLAWSVKVPAKGQASLEEGWKIQGPGTGFIPELPGLGIPRSD